MDPQEGDCDLVYQETTLPESVLKGCYFQGRQLPRRVDVLVALRREVRGDLPVFKFTVIINTRFRS